MIFTEFATSVLECLDTLRYQAIVFHIDERENAIDPLGFFAVGDF